MELQPSISQTPTKAQLKQVGLDVEILPVTKLKYREPLSYTLVKFKKDSVRHVCQSTEVTCRRRKRDSKIVTFAKYRNAWYECVVLSNGLSKKQYLQEVHAANKRAKCVVSSRTKRKSHGFYLVQFRPTHDFQIVSSEVILSKKEGKATIHCPDGATRVAMVVDTGDYEKMNQKLNSITKYNEQNTPEKRSERNPLIPLTPRVQVSPSILQKCKVFKRSLSMQSTESLKEQSLVTKDEAWLAELLNEVKDMNFVSVDEVSDPLCSTGPPMPGAESPLNKNEARPEEFPADVKSPDFVSEDEVSDPLCSTGPPMPGAESPLNKNEARPEEFPADVKSPDFVSDDEVSDPYATNSDSDYIPSSTGTSPAPSISNELLNSFEWGDNEELPRVDPPSSQPPIKAECSGKAAASEKKFYKRQRSACIFCKKLCVRMSRHLQAVHQNHPQVAAVLSITNQRERKAAWKKLRLHGNYEHNCSVLQRKSGHIITQRRSSLIKPDDYLPCQSCKGFFKRVALYKHAKRCGTHYKKYDRVQSRSRLSMPENVVFKRYNQRGMHILTGLVYSKMNTDDVTRTAQNDEMIVKWGADYCAVNMQDPTKAYLARNCSQRMRQMGRLLLIIKRKCGDICTLREFLHPLRFEELVDAAATASGLKEGRYVTASLPIVLRASLKRCADILIGEANKTEDDKLHTSVRKFLELMDLEWERELTSRSRRQLAKQRFEKRSVKVIPLVQDVMKFMNYLQAEEARLVKQLQKEFSYTVWAELCRVLLSSLVVFNRKRIGDVDKITLACYQNRCDAVPQTAIYESLDQSEKLVASAYSHFYTRGKKDSQVPVMVPKKQLPSLDLIIRYRFQAGVGNENVFLFGRGESSFFDGNQTMRRLTAKSQIKNHQLLRSTGLRKQVATLSQVMSMKSGDLDVLATYLGHTTDVHKRFYRLPPEALHLARISRLLAAVNTDNVESIRGKSLDDLPMPTVDDTLEYLQMDSGETTSTNDTDGRRASTSAEGTIDYTNVVPSTSSDRPMTSTNRRTCQTSKFKIAHQRVKKSTSSKNAPVVRKPWVTAEKEAVLRHLSSCIEENRLPLKAEVCICLEQEPVLRYRTWRNVKDFVRNIIYGRSSKR